MAAIPAILPTTISSGIWMGAEKRSAVLSVANVRPQPFGINQYLTLSTPPKAEIVGAGADKGASGGALTPMTVPPIKVHATIRVDQEVQWADQDHQLLVMADLAFALEQALAEQIDAAVIHRVSVLQGTPVASITTGLSTSGPEIEANLLTSTADLFIEQAAGLVVGAGYTPTGAIVDGGYAFAIGSARDNENRPLNPNFPLTGAVDNYRGLRYGVSQAVSGRNFMADTGLRAIVGDFSALAFGLVRDIPIETILYGDPDGLGDLKRKNQIAIRGEMLFGFGIFAGPAFARVVDKVTDVLPAP